MVFIMDRGLYCFRAIPFGLKNAGATYQQLVNRMFTDQIGRNIEVYVDDLLITSLEVYVKLNPAKWSFGLESGKFRVSWSQREE